MCPIPTTKPATEGGALYLATFADLGTALGAQIDEAGQGLFKDAFIKESPSASPLTAGVLRDFSAAVSRFRGSEQFRALLARMRGGQAIGVPAAVKSFIDFMHSHDLVLILQRTATTLSAFAKDSMDIRERVLLGRASKLLSGIEEKLGVSELPEDALRKLKEITVYLSDTHPDKITCGLVLLEVFCMTYFEKLGEYYRIQGEFERLAVANFDAFTWRDTVRSALDKMRAAAKADLVDARRFAAAVPRELASKGDQNGASLRKALFLLLASGERDLFRIFLHIAEPSYSHSPLDNQFTGEQKDLMTSVILVAAARGLSPRQRELASDAVRTISGPNFAEDEAYREYYGAVTANLVLHLSRPEPSSNEVLDSEFSHAMSIITYRKSDARAALAAVSAIADPRVPSEILSTALNTDRFMSWYVSNIGARARRSAPPQRGGSGPRSRRTPRRSAARGVSRTVLRGAIRCMGRAVRAPRV